MVYEEFWVVLAYVLSYPLALPFLIGGGGGVDIVILGTSPRILVMLEAKLPEGIEQLEDFWLLIIKGCYIYV